MASRRKARFVATRRTAARIGILVLSCLFSLLLVEVALRTVLPIYEYAASSDAQRDSARIWRRPAGARSVHRHPDTGTPHPVIYNDLGLRQHRNFDLASLGSRFVVGLFGDSFTENVRLPVTDGFGEVLDYLLNLQIEAEVLNLGVDGYGIGQSYLTWRESDLPFDVVLYVLCLNDFRNLYENAIFAIEEDGSIVETPPPPAPRYVHWLGRLHLTYAAIDLRNRMRLHRTAQRFGIENLVGHGRRRRQRERFHSPEADRLYEQVLAAGEGVFDEMSGSGTYAETTRLFRHLLERWRDEAASRGQRFVVVGLPRPRESAVIQALDGDFETIDLHRALLARDPDFTFDRIRFARDGHWNERGNELAAEVLYERLVTWQGLEPIPEGERRERLSEYYAAFSGWSPPWASDQVDSTVIPGLRARYVPLE